MFNEQQITPTSTQGCHVRSGEGRGVAGTAACSICGQHGELCATQLCALVMCIFVPMLQHAWYQNRRHVEVAFAVTDLLPANQERTTQAVKSAVKQIASLYQDKDFRKPHFSLSAHRYHDNFTSAYIRETFDKKIRPVGLPPYDRMPCCRDDAACSKTKFASQSKQCHDDVGYGITDVVLNEMLALQTRDESPLCSWILVTQVRLSICTRLVEFMSKPLLISVRRATVGRQRVLEALNGTCRSSIQCRTQVGSI